MPFPGQETDMGDFTFGQNLDDTSSGTGNPRSTASGKSPTDSTYSSLGDELSYYNSNFMCADNMTDPFPLGSMPSPLDFSNLSQLESLDVPALSAPACKGPSACHLRTGPVDLAKITELEVWNTPLPVKTEDDDSRSESSPSASSHSQQPSSKLRHTKAAPPSRPPVKRANSHGNKPLGRSQPSSSSETQSHPKKRHSTSSVHDFFAANDAWPKAKPEDAAGKPESRVTTKTSHSVVERKYRENINTKISQLDQTLTSIRAPCKFAASRSADDSGKIPGKARKADVLNEAARYITQSEIDGQARAEEIEFLRLRVAALEKLVNCGDCSLLKQFSNAQLGLGTDF